MIKPFAHLFSTKRSPEEAAAYWFARIESGSMDADAQAEFDAWKEASPGHADAFAKVVAIWNAFDLADMEPGLADLREEAALAARPERRGFLWAGATVAAAASFFAAVYFGPGIVTGEKNEQVRVESSEALAPQVAADAASPTLEFVTAKGERRTVALSDGSRVTLNTDSAIRVAFEQDRRAVTLLRGQGLFEVERNPARPFIVRAGGRQVTALGTVFDIRLDPNRSQITLVSGKVRVDNVASGTQDAPETPTFLSPGYTLTTEKGLGQTLVKVDVDRNLLWRDGFVEFDNTPLAKVVEEMNRYSSVEMVLDSPAAGQLTVSGIFRTDNPERFVDILGEALPLRSYRRSDGNIVIMIDCGGEQARPDCGKNS